jgi:hypothetical protein
MNRSMIQIASVERAQIRPTFPALETDCHRQWHPGRVELSAQCCWMVFDFGSK